MSKNETVTGKVTATKRHGVTVYGNPMMSIQLDSGDWYRISNNSGLVYAIENREYREHAHRYDLTRAGRLSGVAARTDPCKHTTPAPFGSTDVRWKSGGSGTVTTPCNECGEWATWSVS